MKAISGLPVYKCIGRETFSYTDKKSGEVKSCIKYYMITRLSGNHGTGCKCIDFIKTPDNDCGLEIDKYYNLIYNDRGYVDTALMIDTPTGD